MKNKIFLSYSYQDKAWVSEFVQVLNAKGVNAWFDMADIKLGESIHDVIANALRESTVLVVILSEQSVKSPWIFFELGAAVADKKKIIPVLIDDTRFEEIPMPLIKYQFLKESSAKDAGEKIARALSEAENGTTRP
jgi:hypothetical protein